MNCIVLFQRGGDDDVLNKITGGFQDVFNKVYF